jgi:DNA-binding MarR family transcriptional regulator
MEIKSIREASCLLRNADQALEAANVDLTPQQAAVLGYVAEQENNVTLGAVAKAFHITPAVVTGLIDRLERANAIERVKSAGDRRAVFLQITPTGADLLIDAEQALRAAA